LSVKSPFLIKKRIIDKGSLWGVLVENEGKLYKVDVRELLGLIVYFGRTVLVDIKHADKPASLAVAHRKTKDSLIFYFRSVHDQLKGNNFNKVEAIKLITANKYKVLKAA